MSLRASKTLGILCGAGAGGPYAGSAGDECPSLEELYGSCTDKGIHP